MHQGSSSTMTSPVPDHDDLSNQGERAIVRDNFLYWAHLSIYRFGAAFAPGQRVLDVGSGSGYGAAYLARHGAASVEALEGSPEAVEHSRRRYAADPVRYTVADLNQPLPFGDREFGLVFSSNVFEHVAAVDQLAAECARVVAPDGVVLVAVPPIFDAASMAADIENEFHVHHIPPTAWHAKLSRFFEMVQCHAHYGVGRFSTIEALSREAALPDGETAMRETDFAFPEIAADRLLTERSSASAIYVCRAPRSKPLPASLTERTPPEWQEGAAAARVIASLKAANGALHARGVLPPGLRDSALWRLSSPIRWGLRRLRRE